MNVRQRSRRAQVLDWVSMVAAIAVGLGVLALIVWAVAFVLGEVAA